MRYSINLNKDLLSKFAYFTSEYVDLVYKDKFVILCSDTVDFYAHATIPVLTRDSGEIDSIRIPSRLLSDLSCERILDIHILESSIRCVFSNEKKEFLYSTEISKQVCFVDYRSKLMLQASAEKYKRYNLNSINPICATLSKLNSNIICINEFIYSEHNRCFLFTKAELPNFCIPAKILSKILTYSLECRFIENYMYFNYGEISIFLTKHRVPISSDIDYILKSGAKEKYTLDTSKLSLVSRKARCDSNSSCLINLNNGELIIESDEKNMKVNVPVIDKVLGAKPESKSVDEMLDNLDMGGESIKLEKLPTYKMPGWLVNCIVKTDRSDMIVYKSFVVLKLKLCNIAFPRSVYER